MREALAALPAVGPEVKRRDGATGDRIFFWIVMGCGLFVLAALLAAAFHEQISPSLVTVYAASAVCSSNANNSDSSMPSHHSAHKGFNKVRAWSKLVQTLH